MNNGRRRKVRRQNNFARRAQRNRTLPPTSFIFAWATRPVKSLKPFS
jgi:hypothetical protein